MTHKHLRQAAVAASIVCLILALGARASRPHRTGAWDQGVSPAPRTGAWERERLARVPREPGGAGVSHVPHGSLGPRRLARTAREPGTEASRPRPTEDRSDCGRDARAPRGLYYRLEGS
ncbi:MAG TPA: hypothetical protein VE135_04250 [Pyrinomonadaceae bacterium]|nr:hypothetical protein [Pyrinomonadaceae bacterium]